MYSNRILYRGVWPELSVCIHCKMGAKETKQLRRDFESIKYNDPTLRSLDYEGTQLGNDGARSLALALRSNTNLRKLLLGRCNIGPEGLHNLVRCLCEDRLIPSRLRKLELVSKPYDQYLLPLVLCQPHPFLCRVLAPPPHLRAIPLETKEPIHWH